MTAIIALIVTASYTLLCLHWRRNQLSNEANKFKRKNL